MDRASLPRVNTALSRFLHAWNNYPLSSESNLTPSQVWIAGLSRSADKGQPPDVSHLN